MDAYLTLTPMTYFHGGGGRNYLRPKKTPFNRNIVFSFWYIEEIYPDRQFVQKNKSWDSMVSFWQPLKNIKIILKFSDLLGFAIGKVGVLWLPWAAKIKRGHLEWSGVFPLGLDRHKRVYKVSAGQLPTDFFEFQCDTFLRRWLRPPPHEN